MKRFLSKKGFSLVELIVVIAIMAILAAIIVPVTVNKIDDAHRGSAISYIDGLYSVLTSAYANEVPGVPPTTAADLCAVAEIEVQKDDIEGSYGYIVKGEPDTVAIYLTKHGEILTGRLQFKKTFAANGFTES